ncbi:uncharacterized protein SEPMUDRAFT_150647 [Sphaerulina musiva SO2202]|uniref:Uncharacterized protein n=1 Tax=Sphaerulina musiva (strain SO2202) TaxID=692275 RepID=N1QHG4_SPHMS|nr:uncharacterized protein SEPMUDRAFT_150647 [Sphaerulina musiva SO2202]EMF10598.1 hypothetical protein SEPMUDRAFT_150647 [Sphaerulina musiva SO2202]
MGKEVKVSDLFAALQQLQATDSEAALALVTARPDLRPAARNGAETGNEDDPDLNRAKDLLHLHQSVKLAHPDAQPDAALKQARADVAKVLSEV